MTARSMSLALLRGTQSIISVTSSVTGGRDDAVGSPSSTDLSNFMVLSASLQCSRALGLALDGHGQSRQSRRSLSSSMTANGTRDGASQTLLDDRQTIARTTKLEYVPHSRSGHCTGTPSPFHSSQDGLPIPAACDQAARPP
jgi:hypothetical protein